MKYSIVDRPSYAMAVIELESGEAIRGESGCMVAMSSNINIDSKMQGGFLKSLTRSVLGGESMFQTTFTAQGAPGEVLCAPSTPGDVRGIEIDGMALVIQSGSFLCCDASVTLDTKFGGKSLFAGEGLFWLHASGKGTVLISSFGAIYEKVLAAGQTYIVDTGHIVAFDASANYSIKKAAKGLFSSLTSGEGLVAEFSGPGRVLLQSRNMRSFVDSLIPFLPKKK